MKAKKLRPEEYRPALSWSRPSGPQNMHQNYANSLRISANDRTAERDLRSGKA